MGRVRFPAWAGSSQQHARCRASRRVCTPPVTGSSLPPERGWCTVGRPSPQLDGLPQLGRGWFSGPNHGPGLVVRALLRASGVQKGGPRRQTWVCWEGWGFALQRRGPRGRAWKEPVNPLLEPRVVGAPRTGRALDLRHWPVQRVIMRGPSTWWAPRGAGACGEEGGDFPRRGEGGERAPSRGTSASCASACTPGARAGGRGTCRGASEATRPGPGLTLTGSRAH